MRAVVRRTERNQRIAVSATSRMLRADIAGMMSVGARQLVRCLVDKTGKHRLVGWTWLVTWKAAAATVPCSGT